MFMEDKVIASDEASEIVRLYKEWSGRLAANPEMDFIALREMFEGWHTLSSEAPGIAFREVRICGIPAIWCLPANATESSAIIYFHGGGYVLGSMHSHRKLGAHLAARSGIPTLVVDYRLTPDFGHLAPFDDALTVIFALASMGTKAERMILAGDSAGAGLATATALAMRGRGRPAGVVAFSPYYDMQAQGASLKSRASMDALGTEEMVKGMIATFLNGSEAKDAPAHLLGRDLTGMPPILIVASDHDVLRDDAVRFADEATAAGVDVDLDIADCMQHVFVLGAGRVPEADLALERAGRWIREKLQLSNSAS